MPIYEYECKKCKRTWECYKKSYTDADNEICTICGNKATKLISTGSTFILKGNGWFSTAQKIIERS